MTVTDNQPPVIVGGVGGSGTRVVAEMLLRLGYHLGTDRNEAQDNLWFTLLFKRPRWFDAVGRWAPHREEMARGFDILDKALHTGCPFSRTEREFVLAARDEMRTARPDRDGSGAWADDRARTLLAAPDRVVPGQRWGWKEPNSHIFLPELADRFPDARYIHVIRHGLDMAFSPNQAQVRNWGPALGVTVPDDPARLPAASLAYWLAANRRAVRLGQQLFDERLLLLNFDELCRDPDAQTRRLAAFLGTELSANRQRELASLPRTPGSTGRYRNADLGVFTEADFAAVREFGFDVVP